MKLAMFYYIDLKDSVRFENNVPCTLNLTEMITHLLEQPYHFILLLQVFYLDSCLTLPLSECNVLPGVLPSKFAVRKAIYSMWIWLCYTNVKPCTLVTVFKVIA